ncbi:MAG TPA: FAD-binding protein [Spirochaetota bacterium]|nr:FAD-binding protein [Spirochaetota bacterium]HQE58796.1 FAD-binding protein [Spirochaetota bacterium]
MKCGIICESYSGINGEQYENYLSFLRSKGDTVYAFVINDSDLFNRCSKRSDYAVYLKGIDFENIKETVLHFSNLFDKYSLDNFSGLSSIYTDIIIPLISLKKEFSFIPNISNTAFSDKHQFIRRLGDGSSERIESITSKCCFTFGTERLDKYDSETEPKAIYEEIYDENYKEETIAETPKQRKNQKTRISSPVLKSYLSAGKALRDHSRFEKTIIPAARKLSCLSAVSVDAMREGIAGREKSIGISSNCISPELYISVGDSGSIEHLNALRSAKYIVSVNQESRNRYSYFADLDIKCDISKFLHRLDEKISKILKL